MAYIRKLAPMLVALSLVACLVAFAMFVRRKLGASTLSVPSVRERFEQEEGVDPPESDRIASHVLRKRIQSAVARAHVQKHGSPASPATVREVADTLESRVTPDTSTETLMQVVGQLL